MDVTYDPKPTPKQLEEEAVFLGSVPEGSEIFYFDAEDKPLKRDNSKFYALLARADVKVPDLGKSDAPLTITKNDGSGEKEITKEQFLSELPGGVKVLCIHTDGYHIPQSEMKAWPSWMRSMVISAGAKSFTVQGSGNALERFVEEFNRLEKSRGVNAK